MRIVAKGFLVAAVILPCLIAGNPAKAASLQLLTEDYPPYGYLEDGKPVGTTVDQVRAIMTELDIDYTLEILPWARAFALAQNQQMTCVFATTVTAERHSAFKWILPLVNDRLILVRKARSNHTPLDLADARGFSVGVHLEDVGEDFVRQNGFSNIDTAPTLDLSLKKLMNGRVDLLVTTDITLQDLRRQGYALEHALTLEDRPAGIACNLSVPDIMIERMQSALSGLIADGSQERIFARYRDMKK